jgi:hypothetical protein
VGYKVWVYSAIKNYYEALPSDRLGGGGESRGGVGDVGLEVVQDNGG